MLHKKLGILFSILVCSSQQIQVAPLKAFFPLIKTFLPLTVVTGGHFLVVCNTISNTLEAHRELNFFKKQVEKSKEGIEKLAAALN